MLEQFEKKYLEFQRDRLGHTPTLVLVHAGYQTYYEYGIFKFCKDRDLKLIYTWEISTLEFFR